MSIGVGLYGVKGHQIQNRLVDHARARLLAIAGMEIEALPESLRGDKEIRQYAGLDEMLGDDRVDLVSLCSPQRRDQAQETVRCLQAGKHAYAEKPCAMTESDSTKYCYCSPGPRAQK
jgi:predicted dehydrogenase